MEQDNRSKYPGYGFSERHADHRMDEARLGLRLERAYAAREARLAPSDDALAKLNATLDAIGSSPHRRMEHRYLFGACVLAALLLLLLSPVAWSEFTANTRHATRSVAVPIDRAVGSGISATAARSEIVTPPVAVMASDAASVAPPEQRTATNPIAATNGTTLTAETSNTPLRDLLARAGIHASDPPGVSVSAGHLPQH
ncbi:MAG: hypothetical protein M3Y58_20635 [Chloroflexota bacterium]|nr:hypothetical protein [Chloroflexota bacterium]